ncbi:MAG TPA: trypsin-like peptidase domain-containing protein [Chloroflexota bacterium]|nr:trypsin-like peptidase domain-containing protein [Chloroflexota bacterium]
MYSYNEEPTQRYPVVGPPPRRRTSRAALAGVLLLGVVLGGATGGAVAHFIAPAATEKIVTVSSPANTSAAAPADSVSLPPLRVVDTSDRVVEVVKRVGPAVVTIQATGYDDSGNQVFQASGSGVIINNKGDILTNDHVVSASNAANSSFSGIVPSVSYKVIFQSGQSAAATLVGEAADNDLAVIHTDAKVPAWADLGDSSKVEPGQTVLAIGNPLGSFQNTVTEGIISAKGRTLQESSTTSLTGLLQTDAAINHGNSGGPLVDLNGKVIGINTAVVRSSSDTSNPQDPFGFFSSTTTDPAQGLGFAIPSNTARQVIGRILLRLPPGYLGVSADQILPQAAAYYNVPVGAIVRTIGAGTPAEKAGLKKNDIITAVDGQAIDQNHLLATVVQMHQPGQTVKLTVWRSGQTLTIDVKLAPRPKQNS